MKVWLSEGSDRFAYLPEYRSILFTGVGLFRWLAGDLMRMGLAII